MKNVTNRTLKSLVAKDLEIMSQKELKAFAIRTQEVLSTILSTELKKEAAYLELKSCTNYRKITPAVNEQEQVLNLASQEIACGLDSLCYNTDQVNNDFEFDEAELQRMRDDNELSGMFDVSTEDLLVPEISTDEINCWGNGSTQLDGYVIVDGCKCFFQANSALPGPTVFGDWKHNKRAKELIESRKPDFFKPIWKSVDEYKIYTEYKNTKCMVTALNHERTKFMGYIGEYAWIWDLKKLDRNSKPYMPLITLSEELVVNGRHNTNPEQLKALRNTYTDLIKMLVNKHRSQVKSGIKKFPVPTNSSDLKVGIISSGHSNTNTNKKGGDSRDVSLSSIFNIVQVSQADIKKVEEEQIAIDLQKNRTESNCSDDFDF